MLTRKVYNDGGYVAYAYNAEGSLARLSYGDSTGELASYRFEYDSLGRLIRSAELDADGSTVQRTEHIYDGYNRLSRQSWTLGDKTYSESYVYDDPSDTNKNGDGALTQMTTATGAVIDYQYDTLRRLTRSKVTLNGSAIYTTAYAFRDLDASRTTTQVQYRNVRNANGEVLEGKKYTYDALGNITRISQSTKPFYTLVAYEYDAQNQLVKETYYNGKGSAAGNISRTISYTYDTAGNILSETRTEDGETTTKTYGYGDSGWADLLTEVDGQAITYDASGNPTSYFGRTMTWTNGRQLKTSTTHAFGAVLRSTYTYDADGIRKTKTIPINQRGLTCTYTFVTQNGKVVRQRWRTESIDFFYDESGRPFAMTYQRADDAPQTYYYVLNLQGDVVKLVDVSGAEVASYEYDAWGNVLSQSGSMAGVNPLRYRGYYRDSETGFYYLQSRYYDPATRRFINADVYSSTDSSDAVSCNMFAYCGNNPVLLYDPNGELGLIGLCLLAAFTYATVDYGTQVYDNYDAGKTGKDAWVNSINWGSVVASGVSGAAHAIPGASGAATAVDILACPVIEEGVNSIIENRKFNTLRVASNVVSKAVNSLVLSVTIDKFIPSLEVPKYIRDIKDEAHTLFGVKGTNRLNRYLDGKQLFTVFYNSARRMLLE